MVRGDGKFLGFAGRAVEGKELRGNLNIGIHGVLLHAVAFLDYLNDRLESIIGRIRYGETGAAAVSGGKLAGAGSLPVGYAAEAELGMLGVLTVLDHIVSLHIG